MIKLYDAMNEQPSFWHQTKGGGKGGVLDYMYFVMFTVHDLVWTTNVKINHVPVHL